MSSQASRKRCAVTISTRNRKCLNRRFAPPILAVAEALRILGDETVLVLKRLRIASGEPMGIQTARIPALLVPGLVDADLENVSLYEVLQTRYGLQAAKARETHSAVLIGSEEAALLGVEPYSPALAATRVTYLPDGEPFEVVNSIMRGDRYRIVLDLVHSSR